MVVLQYYLRALLFFYFLCHGAFVFSFESCFEHEHTHTSFIKKMEPFLLQGESLKKTSSSCYRFSVRADRRELLKRLVKADFPLADFSSESDTSTITNNNCDVEVIRERWLRNQQQKMDISSKPNVQESTSWRKLQDSTTLKVTKGFSSKVTVIGLSVHVKCLQKTASGISIELSLYAPSSGVALVLDLAKGQQHEIAQSLRQLDDENKKLLAKGRAQDQDQSLRKEKIYIIGI